jgi:hypothetical protein
LFAGGDLLRQSESIKAVDLTLRPRLGSEGGICRETLVVLLDKPKNNQHRSFTPRFWRAKRAVTGLMPNSLKLNLVPTKSKIW